jgi:hypothetical protein
VISNIFNWILAALYLDGDVAWLSGLSDANTAMTPTVAYSLAFCSTFIFVFLKAFQQLNVVHGNYLWILPVSMAMAMCEVYTVVVSAHLGWGWIVLPIGLGGGLGASLAVWIHKRMRKA